MLRQLPDKLDTPVRSFDPTERWYEPDRGYGRWLRYFRDKLQRELQSDRYDILVEAGLLCHNYWRVETGQLCCRGCGPVLAKSSGIGCKCDHRWFCW